MFADNLCGMHPARCFTHLLFFPVSLPDPTSVKVCSLVGG